MKRLILCINFGSTSTKLAIYNNASVFAEQNITHTAEELSKYKTINEQLPMREQCVVDFLKKNHIQVSDLAAISARAGVTKPVDFGPIEINECMVERLYKHPLVEHAMNLCAVVAYRLAKGLSIPIITYDSCTTDQMDPLYKFSGIPEITRSHMSHVENIRAVAFKAASLLKHSYYEMNMVVAHLGGGISATAHQKGRIIDSKDSNDGAFSPERAGILPSLSLAKLIYSGQYTKEEILKRIEGNGGMKAYLGTADGREAEKRILSGDHFAEQVYHAMAAQVAKEIGELSTVLFGRVDAIVLTGGLSYSEMFTQWIRERVSFIAPVILFPGEYEMEALAFGALKVLDHAEVARPYEEELK